MAGSTPKCPEMTLKFERNFLIFFEILVSASEGVKMGFSAAKSETDVGDYDPRFAIRVKILHGLLQRSVVSI